MAVVPLHCSPPRVPQWQLSSWPERDPDCHECQGNHATGVDAQAAANIDIQVGQPSPAGRATTTLQRENQRMMHVISERHAVDVLTIANNPCDELKDRKKAFALFQTLQKGGEWIYAFDFPQALEALRIFIDEQQQALTLRKFNVMPGDLISFDTFNAVVDVIEAGMIPANPGSPPREHAPPCPGSPQYDAGKKEKPVPKGPAPYNPVPYHKVMDGKVQVPQPVRVRHGFDKR